MYLYTAASVAQVFFVTAATFGAMSLWGYTTKRDLTGFGSFLFMGLIGILIASVVNFFLQSGTMSLVISVIGVLVFTGLTAYDTQKIKEEYDVAPRWNDCGQERHHGRASPLSRLHQPVPDAAPPHGRPPLRTAHTDEKSPGEIRGFLFLRSSLIYSGRLLSSLRSSTRRTAVRSWPRPST